MSRASLLLVVSLVFQQSLVVVASGDGRLKASFHSLAEEGCNELGVLSLQHEKSYERPVDGPRRLHEVTSLSLVGQETGATPVRIWARTASSELVGHTSSRFVGAVGCDWRVREIFLVLVEGGPLTFEGEMIRLTLSNPARPPTKMSISEMEFIERSVGSFSFRPHPLAVGYILVSSQQLGRRMLVHMEADGKGAYTGVLFLLDFDAGSAQQVKLVSSPKDRSPPLSLLDPGPYDPTLPVPWDLETDEGTRTEPETLPSSVQESLVEN